MSTFYKELYETEINRKNGIDASVQFPTTILTILIGAFYFIINNDKLQVLNQESNIYNVLLIISISGFVSGVVTTTIFLLMMFHNIKNKYYYLPSPKELKKRECILYEHFLKSHPEIEEREKKASIYSEKMFKNELTEYYIECSDKNQKINDRRLREYYQTRKFLMISIIFLALFISTVIQNS